MNDKCNEEKGQKHTVKIVMNQLFAYLAVVIEL